MAKKIELLCTAFRDGFQSVYGSRILPKDYMPVVKMAKEANATLVPFIITGEYRWFRRGIRIEFLKSIPV